MSLPLPVSHSSPTIRVRGNPNNAPQLHASPNLSWGHGSKGRDSEYEIQRPGWPWARQDGKDQHVLIRVSAIGDGGCFYHALYKSIGTLRSVFRIFDGTDLLDPKMLDVDYRDSKSIYDYFKHKRVPETYMKEVTAYKRNLARIHSDENNHRRRKHESTLPWDPTLAIRPDIYVYRQLMVDTFRNALWKWFLKPAVNDNGVVYTEQEATLIINNDPNTVSMWSRDVARDPNAVSFVSSGEDAVTFLNRCCDTFNDCLKTYPHLADFQTSDAIVSYMEGNVRDNRMTHQISNAIKQARFTGHNHINAAWDVSLFDNAAASHYASTIEGDNGFLRRNSLRCQNLAEYNFYDEAMRNFSTKAPSETLMKMLGIPECKARAEEAAIHLCTTELSQGNPKWYTDGIKDVEKAYRSQARTDNLSTYHQPTLDLDQHFKEWSARMLTVGPERLSNERDVPAEVLRRRCQQLMTKDNISLIANAFFEDYAWGPIAMLVMSRDQDPCLLISIIDKWISEGIAAYDIKQRLENVVSGEYLDLLKEHVVEKLSHVNVVKSMCGFREDSFVYQKYSKEVLDAFFQQAEHDVWELFNTSVTHEGVVFTETDIEEFKTRDPRGIKVNGIPLGCEFNFKGDGMPSVNPSLRALDINCNYFMFMNGYFLRHQEVGSNYDFLRKKLPVNTEVSSWSSIVRQDSGEEIISWMSLLIGTKIHIARCFSDFMWYIHVYPGHPSNIPTHSIIINSTGNHYEPIGLLHDDGTIQYKFPDEHPLIADMVACKQYAPDNNIAITPEAVRTFIASAGELFPDITTETPQVEINSLLPPDPQRDAEDFRRMQRQQVVEDTLYAASISHSASLPSQSVMPMLPFPRGAQLPSGLPFPRGAQPFSMGMQRGLPGLQFPPGMQHGALPHPSGLSQGMQLPFQSMIPRGGPSLPHPSGTPNRRGSLPVRQQIPPPTAVVIPASSGSRDLLPPGGAPMPLPIPLPMPRLGGQHIGLMLPSEQQGNREIPGLRNNRGEVPIRRVLSPSARQIQLSPEDPEEISFPGGVIPNP